MPEPDGLTAALHQLSDHADKLTHLDRREAAHAAQISDRITALTDLTNTMKNSLDDQAEVIAGLQDLDDKVASLAGRLDEIAPADDPVQRGYQPSPSPRFWKLDGEARDEAIARLRGWVEHVYQPGYGVLAASLGSCWEQHSMCLYALDWLSELWSVLYLQPQRTTSTLAGQAEWQTRLLTAAAEQMATETARCEHSVLRTARQVRNGART
jgi:hypothetical protein